MDTIKIDKKNVKLIAHRGVSGLETENTVAAFIAAANRSYYGIETDVHFTSDGKFVCIHDDDTARVAEQKIVIAESTYEQVRQIKLIDRNNGTGDRNDLVIPTLQDYIEICKRYGKQAILEIKNQFPAEKVAQLYSAIKDLGYLDGTTFISFYPQNLFTIKQIAPTQSCQFLTGQMTDEILQGLIAYKMDIDALYTLLDEKLIKVLKSHNIAINAWTCDSKEDAERLIDLGVDYITTNILE